MMMLMSVGFLLFPTQIWRFRLGFCYFQHKFGDFVWVFAVFNINVLILFGFLLISKINPRKKNSGFAGLGPEHAGETLIFGHGPRNLRGANLRTHNFL